MATTRAEPAVAAGEGACAAAEMMPAELRDDVRLRLRKARGQVEGVARMVDDNRYCVDVLTQIQAAQKALDGVAQIVLRNYLERCVTDAIEARDPLIYDELMKVIARFR